MGFLCLAVRAVLQVHPTWGGSMNDGLISWQWVGGGYSGKSSWRRSKRPSYVLERMDEYWPEEEGRDRRGSTQRCGWLRVLRETLAGSTTGRGNFKPHQVVVVNV